MIRSTTERHLRWLMVLRVVIVTTLLFSAFVSELWHRPAESLRQLYLLAAFAYGLSLLYAVLDRWLRGRDVFILAQLIGDVLVVTLFVRLTGGLGSPMSFLYLLPIAVGAMLLYRRGALILAGVSYLLYVTLILGGVLELPLGLVGASTAMRLDPGRILYSLVAHAVAMTAMAVLAASLSERLRAQGNELAERRGAVVRLQALNENIIESINSGLITTDLSGRIHFINRGGSEITGWSQAAVEGQAVESLFSLESGALAEIRVRLLAERRFRFEKYFQTPEGRRIFIGIAASNLYDKTGRPLGYIFIFQDLTEIQALEQEIRLKERMAALGEMAAGIAHELRNPLASMSGAVQYLKGELEPQGETLELMDIILRESQRLDQTIRDFLTFARPGDFAPQQVDLVRLIEDNVKLLRRSRECGDAHEIRTHFSAARMECQVDPNRLKQVFWNLATNALKAMPRGGELTIEAQWSESGDSVEICFSDQGVGMNEAQQARYFQPFASSFEGGTGLGAAIVYRLVQEHAGRIQLESREARGTLVRIVLPVSQEPSPVVPPVPGRRSMAGGVWS